jgi:photosystem II stability/assembly factor-like uncharacterized protein
VLDQLSPNIMYAGGVAGGVWKSLDGGLTWVAKGDLLPNLAVSSMAVARDPSDPTNASKTIIYAGTGEGFNNQDAIRGAGIYKSTNAGESWVLLNDTDRSKFYYMNDIVISPSNVNRVYAVDEDRRLAQHQRGAELDKGVRP